MPQTACINDYRLWIHSAGNDDEVLRILFTVPQVDEARREAVIEIPFSRLENLLPMSHTEKLPRRSAPGNGHGHK